ncbi:MAG: hypothetical protein U0414_18520 [Polyangiaceae bacterium]
MRTFAAAVLTVLFVAAFVSHLALTAVLDVGTSTPTFVATARAADVRGLLLDVAEASVLEAAQREAGPVLAPALGAGVRGALDEAAPEGWFYTALGASHEGLMRYLDGATGGGEVDLTEVRSAVRRQVAKTAAIAPGANAAKLTATVDRLAAAIPEKVSMTMLVANAAAELDANQRTALLRGLRSDLATLRTARLATLIGGIVALVLLALVSMKTAARGLVTVGIALVLASAVYVGAGFALQHVVRDRVVAGLEKARSRDTPVGAALANGLGRLADTAGRAVSRDADGPAYAAVGLGLALLVGGIVLRARRAPRATSS